MSPPVLLIVIGTRAEMLACASLVRLLRAQPEFSLPFTVRVIASGQEMTELDQTLESLEIEPDEDLHVKSPHLADTALNAKLLEFMEALIRHQNPAAVMAVGASATAWATGVAAYFKDVPLIHLGAEDFAPGGARPFPEWLHMQELARLARLHLCSLPSCAEALENIVKITCGTGASLDSSSCGTAAPGCESSEPSIVTTGPSADETLAWSLANPPDEPDDVTLQNLRPGAPRILIFARRREHHANSLRPLCDALDALSERHPDHEFIIVHSLQAHIVDALVALLPKRENLHSISPMPHPAFVREIARASLVITDSAGVVREAGLLHRPVVVVGDYSLTLSAQEALKSSPAPHLIVPMDCDALVDSVSNILSQNIAPLPVPEIAQNNSGQAAFESILAWWNKLNLGRAPEQA